MIPEVARQEARVEVRAVEHRRPQVRQEQDEVPVVPEIKIIFWPS